MDLSDVVVKHIKGTSAQDLENKLFKIKILSNGKYPDVINIATQAPWIAWIRVNSSEVNIPKDEPIQSKPIVKKSSKKKASKKAT